MDVDNDITDVQDDNGNGEVYKQNSVEPVDPSMQHKRCQT